MASTYLSSCRLCGHMDLDDILDLGPHCLSGIFPKLDQPDPPAEPLVLCRCSDCGLVQLRHTVDQASMFTHDYGYRSNLNRAMVDHLSDIVEWTMQRRQLRAGEAVLDIGCNDGTLLGFYQGGDVDRFGVDPIANKFRADYPDDVDLHEDFFTAESAHRLLEARKMAVITSIAMFYDLPDPGDFVAGIASCLADDGIWMLEQSYLPTMLTANAFDSICHEHLEYWALAQVERVLQAHGLRVFDLALNDANGGSFRLAVCHDRASFETSAAVIDQRENEQAMGLDGLEPFDAFRQRLLALRDQTVGMLDDLRAQNKRVLLYGASTKGNTLLQYYGLDGRHFDGAVEVNPEKFGRCTPGTRIPIIPEEGCLDEGVDCFFVLPWHFRDNILRRAAPYLEAGVEFIFPLPELDIVAK